MLIKVRLCGSAWHGSQQCVRNTPIRIMTENNYCHASVLWVFPCIHSNILTLVYQLHMYIYL